MKFVYRFFATALLVAFISACGGGSSSKSAVKSVESVESVEPIEDIKAFKLTNNTQPLKK